MPTKMAELTLASSNKIFNGFQNSENPLIFLPVSNFVIFDLFSTLLLFKTFQRRLKMQNEFWKFGFLLAASENSKLPIIYWLSGLTCNELNFVQKSGGQKYAAGNGVIFVTPDTSPRNVNFPGEDES